MSPRVGTTTAFAVLGYGAMAHIQFGNLVLAGSFADPASPPTQS